MIEKYIKLHKQLKKSDIFSKPPMYLKVWIYLLMKANFVDGHTEIIELLKEVLNENK